MKKAANSLFVGGLLCLPTIGFAYEVDTHEELTATAVISSRLGLQPEALVNLGLEPLAKLQAFPNSKGNPRTILQLFRDGANFEDTASAGRPTNHFYNPLNGAPLSILGISVGSPSPDWALEDVGQISGTLGFGKQEFSYQDAREYLFTALTHPDKLKREKSFGLTFQAMGMVVHHVQDMAQPQHVRNDQHLELQTSQELAACVLGGLGTCAAYFAIKNPSLYEAYTNTPEVRKSLPVNPFIVGYDVNDPKFIGSFNKPRKYWEKSTGEGLAQFTNFNFVSAGTNFDNSGIFNFPLFTPGLRSDIDIKDLCANAKPACKNSNLTGVMTFYGSMVDDRYTAQKTLNPFASTSSIFDADLVKASGKNSFTLNRFNFELAHTFLIPRAVAYSTGLINYFFRGKLEITLPDEGVYGIVDHSVEYQKDTSGFRKIKLKLKNVTPSGNGVEPMANTGKLVAVVKFHRNTCYRPDLSGEYGAPGIDKTLCRSKDEEIVVSTTVDAPVGINEAAQPLTFTFLTPIPINATDVYLQVVYRGPLGEEPDAVVVATKDIAEPNFFGYYDITEQSLYGISSNLMTFKALFCDSATPPIPYDDCKYQHRTSNIVRFTPPTNYDAANPEASFVATVVFSEVPVSRFARVAFLSETTDQSIYNLHKSYNGGAAPKVDPTVYSYSLKPWINQENNGVLNSIDLFLTRGVYTNDSYRGLLTSGDAPNPPNLNPALPVPSQINF